jgi:hypothetical protein
MASLRSPNKKGRHGAGDFFDLDSESDVGERALTLLGQSVGKAQSLLDAAIVAASAGRDVSMHLQALVRASSKEESLVGLHAQLVELVLQNCVEGRLSSAVATTVASQVQTCGPASCFYALDGMSKVLFGSDRGLMSEHGTKLWTASKGAEDVVADEDLAGIPRKPASFDELNDRISRGLSSGMDMGSLLDWIPQFAALLQVHPSFQAGSDKLSGPEVCERLLAIGSRTAWSPLVAAGVASALHSAPGGTAFTMRLLHQLFAAARSAPLDDLPVLCYRAMAMATSSAGLSASVAKRHRFVALKHLFSLMDYRESTDASSALWSAQASVFRYLELAVGQDTVSSKCLQELIESRCEPLSAFRVAVVLLSTTSETPMGGASSSRGSLLASILSTSASPAGAPTVAGVSSFGKSLPLSLVDRIKHEAKAMVIDRDNPAIALARSKADGARVLREPFASAIRRCTVGGWETVCPPMLDFAIAMLDRSKNSPAPVSAEAVDAAPVFSGAPGISLDPVSEILGDLAQSIVSLMLAHVPLARPAIFSRCVDSLVAASATTDGEAPLASVTALALLQCVRVAASSVGVSLFEGCDAKLRELVELVPELPEPVLADSLRLVELVVTSSEKHSAGLRRAVHSQLLLTCRKGLFLKEERMRKATAQAVNLLLAYVVERALTGEIGSDCPPLLLEMADMQRRGLTVDSTTRATVLAGLARLVVPRSAGSTALGQRVLGKLRVFVRRMVTESLSSFVNPQSISATNAVRAARLVTGASPEDVAMPGTPFSFTRAVLPGETLASTALYPRLALITSAVAAAVTTSHRSSADHVDSSLPLSQLAVDGDDLAGVSSSQLGFSQAAELARSSGIPRLSMPAVAGLIEVLSSTDVSAFGVSSVFLEEGAGPDGFQAPGVAPTAAATVRAAAVLTQTLTGAMEALCLMSACGGRGTLAALEAASKLSCSVRPGELDPVVENSFHQLMLPEAAWTLCCRLAQKKQDIEVILSSLNKQRQSVIATAGGRAPKRGRVATPSKAGPTSVLQESVMLASLCPMSELDLLRDSIGSLGGASIVLTSTAGFRQESFSSPLERPPLKDRPLLASSAATVPLVGWASDAIHRESVQLLAGVQNGRVRRSSLSRVEGASYLTPQNVPWNRGAVQEPVPLAQYCATVAPVALACGWHLARQARDMRRESSSSPKARGDGEDEEEETELSIGELASVTLASSVALLEAGANLVWCLVLGASSRQEQLDAFVQVVRSSRSIHRSCFGSRDDDVDEAFSFANAFDFVAVRSNMLAERREWSLCQASLSIVIVGTMVSTCC